ncbi:uncharacterized protein PAC_05681 [Phialocephala subalpina]|uniref:Uncharacterized protein n=1 Tax=Phialocephala subalpina TaxID=576137 RepID=A0A1L7WSQ5_9HELO|nr:uncharacterized protein PAC_05681 [Phialocephala subalpina]
MSNPAPSIPTFPPPGKDPPPASTSANENTSPFPDLLPVDRAIEFSPHPPPHSPTSTSKEKDKASKPPPTRPTITTQAPTQPPSRESTFHGSNLPSTFNSHNTDGYSISSYLPTEEKPRPEFKEFFTLVNDVKEKEGETGTFHPSRIHYVFSDDDASEVLSAALLRTLEQQNNPQSQHQQLEDSKEAIRAESTATSSSSSATFKTHAHKHSKKNSGDKLKKEKEKENKREREERIIIVDVNENGDGVRSVSSLSKDWQVLGASIDNAPTWDGADDSDPSSRNPSGGLMLRIEGASIDPSSFPDEKSKGMGESGRASGTIGEEEMQNLLEGFDRKMAVLRRVVGQHEQQIQAHTQHGGSTLRQREGSGGSAVTGGGDGATEILEAGTG